MRAGLGLDPQGTHQVGNECGFAGACQPTNGEQGIAGRDAGHDMRNGVFLIDGEGVRFGAMRGHSGDSVGSGVWYYSCEAR